MEGGKSYTLHVPANPPAEQFWSIAVYSWDTRTLIDNEQKRAGQSSRQDLIKNKDGSIDLYYGPTAPKGKEKNWVQTIPGQGWWVYLRFYAPTKVFSSTGQRNTPIEYFCWGTEAQRLSRPLVQFQSCSVQFCLRASGQVGALREVLAQETVRVLVRSTLPRALRVTEIDLNVCRDRELLVCRHLQPAIPGQRFP